MSRELCQYYGKQNCPLRPAVTVNSNNRVSTTEKRVGDIPAIYSNEKINHSLSLVGRGLIISAPAPTKMAKVAVDENKAKEFLSSLRRQKRQLWDRTRPEVQQWYQQFLYMGFDEAKFEDDVTYWLNRGRNGHDYYDYHHQRHYDEEAAVGPRSPHSFRHGASVNYDDYY
ncbi:Augurin [Galemys pyrenaicus]|uniref:Augurin n=1 Tax=Galemys pyrenaicus TaxID=202257 RepID=A0A8J6DBS0_GALPY|nr:Augurin [Galemys pyrenaicus]